MRKRTHKNKKRKNYARPAHGSHERLCMSALSYQASSARSFPAWHDVSSRYQAPSARRHNCLGRVPSGIEKTLSVWIRQLALLFSLVFTCSLASGMRPRVPYLYMHDWTESAKGGTYMVRICAAKMKSRKCDVTNSS